MGSCFKVSDIERLSLPALNRKRSTHPHQDIMSLSTIEAEQPVGSGWLIRHPQYVRMSACPIKPRGAPFSDSCRCKGFLVPRTVGSWGIRTSAMLTSDSVVRKIPGAHRSRARWEPTTSFDYFTADSFSSAQATIGFPICCITRRRSDPDRASPKWRTAS